MSRVRRKARGVFDIAHDMDYVDLCFSGTAPSQYHPWKTIPQGHGLPTRTRVNPTYLGRMPLTLSEALVATRILLLFVNPA